MTGFRCAWYRRCPQVYLGTLPRPHSVHRRWLSGVRRGSRRRRSGHCASHRCQCDGGLSCPDKQYAASTRSGRWRALLLAGCLRGPTECTREPSPPMPYLSTRLPDRFHDCAFLSSLCGQGSLFLFGKVKVDGGGFASCCSSLKGFERNIYVLPRKRMLVDGIEIGDEVSFAEVFKEVQQLCRAHKVTKFACKRVERSYAFEDASVPSSTSYLKVVYSAEFPPLPFDASGVTYSKVFGSQTSCLERLLLKRRIMGPCWLHLSDVIPATTQSSWCKCGIAQLLHEHAFRAAIRVIVCVRGLRRCYLFTSLRALRCRDRLLSRFALPHPNPR